MNMNHQQARPGLPAAPATTVEDLQRRFIDAVAELGQISEQLQRAQWIREYEQADLAQPSVHLLGREAQLQTPLGSVPHRRDVRRTEPGNQ